MENHVSARAWAGDKIPTWSIRRCWYSRQTLGLALEKDSRRHYIRSRIRKMNVVSQYVRLVLTLSGRMDNQGTRGWVCYARFGELNGCSVSPRRSHSHPNLPTMALTRTPPSRLRARGTLPIPEHVPLTSYNVA